MGPMDAPLQASNHPITPQIILSTKLLHMETELKTAKQKGHELTEGQDAKIKELFAEYSKVPEKDRPKKFNKYPLLVDKFKGLMKEKLL